MPNPRLLHRTGNAQVDRQNREFVNAGTTYEAKVVITGQNRAVIKSVPHMLGRAPTGWRVVRGDGSKVTESTSGAFTRDYADLQFEDNGTWTIEFQ